MPCNKLAVEFGQVSSNAAALIENNPNAQEAVRWMMATSIMRLDSNVYKGFESTSGELVERIRYYEKGEGAYASAYGDLYNEKNAIQWFYPWLSLFINDDGTIEYREGDSAMSEGAAAQVKADMDAAITGLANVLMVEKLVSAAKTVGRVTYDSGDTMRNDQRILHISFPSGIKAKVAFASDGRFKTEIENQVGFSYADAEGDLKKLGAAMGQVAEDSQSEITFSGVERHVHAPDGSHIHNHNHLRF